MGTLYFGELHEEIKTYEHEGYTVRVFADGTETGTFGGEYGWTGHEFYAARCECGWKSPNKYPVPDPDPYESPEADADWDAHIAELVERARRNLWGDWQESISALARGVERAATEAPVTARRLRDAGDYLDRMATLIERRKRIIHEMYERLEA